MFVCPQISAVKHLWVDLHDEVDRFVFWQYICHPGFPCQEVRFALGVIRWLISVLWDVLPCLLCFKWQKAHVLSGPCCRNSHPLCKLYFLTARRLDAQHMDRGNVSGHSTAWGESSILSHTPWSIWGCRVPPWPLPYKPWNAYLDTQHSHITSCIIPV